MKKELLVFVALSGGVDSSVVLQLIKKQYKNIYGISHIVWPESLCCTTESLDQCCWQCEQEKIPYAAVDVIQGFSKKVIDLYVTDYFEGRTPNPCVLCNEEIRFELMITEFFKNHPECKTANYKIATGHYAQLEEKKGFFYLKKGADPLKDQAYVLYRLSQAQLKHVLFPLGKLKKQKVRKLADKYRLKAAKKKDSMGACFTGGDYRPFLKEYSGKKVLPGNFLDKAGKIIAKHEGYPFYTRGQRRGLGLSGGPWYVLEVRPKTNEVVLGEKKDLLINQFYITDIVWNYPKKNIKKATVQTRHHAPELKCNFEWINDDKILIKLKKPYAEVGAGQSAVLYDGNYVMGGGVISFDVK